MKWGFDGGRWIPLDVHGHSEWSRGDGRWFYWATEGCLRGVPTVAEMSWDDATNTLSMPDGGSKDAPNANVSSWETLTIDVTPLARGAEWRLADWPTTLPSVFSRISVSFGGRAVEFSRQAEEFSAECNVSIGSETPVAQLDHIALGVVWRWRPAIESWGSLWNGNMTILAGLTDIVDGRGLVLLRLHHTAPDGAAVCINGEDWALTECSGLARSTTFDYCLKRAGNLLTWSTAVAAATGVVTFKAEGYDAYPYDTTLLRNIRLAERYKRIVAKMGRTYLDVTPVAPISFPSLFGPTEPVFPGTDAQTTITTLAGDLSRATDAVAAGVLPTDRVLRANEVHFLRTENSYGVFVSALETLPAGDWVRRVSLAPAGIVSWQGLVDEYDIKGLSNSTTGTQSLALLFRHGFLLNDDFWWAAPFGSVGMVKELRRWCSTVHHASAVSRNIRGWETSVHHLVDLAKATFRKRDAQECTLPFCVALTDDPTRSAPILEIAPQATSAMLRGLLASDRGLVESMGPPVRLFLEEIGPHTLAEDQRIDFLPETFRSAASHARSEAGHSMPGSDVEGVRWARRDGHLTFEHIENTAGSGVFVLCPLSERGTAQ